jgi:iron complex transport system permease protein
VSARGRAIAIGVVVLVAAVIAGLLVGPARIGAANVLRWLLAFGNPPTGMSEQEASILGNLRLPRVIVGGLVGASLAASGAAYQAVFRNPLADPYLLGAASGAGLGATVAIVGAGTALGGATSAVPVAAFVGAIAAVGLAYGLGASADRLRSNASLILAGVAVAALCSALQTFLLQRDDEAVRDVYAWLLGRLNTAAWDDVRLLLPYAVVSLATMLVAARRLDVLALGDEEAEALGARPRRLRIVVVVAASLGTAAAVAVSGLVGFVGIIVPHAVRLRCGPSNGRILPLTALYGGAFLCLADLVARTALAPAEIPLGVITAAVGAPFFLVVLRSSRNVGS